MNRFTGCISYVSNTTLAVPTLACEMQTHWTSLISSKWNALLNQPTNSFSTFFGNVSRSGFHHKASTCI